MATNYTHRDIHSKCQSYTKFSGNDYRFSSELLKVKSKAKVKGDLKDVANCCNVLGELFQQQGKYEDAITEHEVRYFSLMRIVCCLYMCSSQSGGEKGLQGIE